jgi:type I restriction enzyme, S subunit
VTELPPGWAWTKVGEIADVQLGKMLDKAKNRGTPTAYLRNINVRWGKLDLSDLLEMRFTEDEMDFFDIRDGDLIVCEGGEPGRAAVWRQGPTRLKYQKALHRVRTGAGVSPEYLAHFLRHAAHTDLLTPLLTGTTIKHLPRTAFLRLGLPLPPAAEQRRIVAKLDSLFARTRSAREELARIPRLIEHYKQAILAAAFRGELTADWRKTSESPPIDVVRYQQDAALARGALRGSRQALSNLEAPDEALGQLPNGWVAGRLIDLIDLRVGFAFKSKWFQKTGIRLVRGANVSPGRLDWRDTVFLDEDRRTEFAEYLIEAGDILLAMDRPLISSGLKVAVLRDEEAPALLVQRVARIRPSTWARAAYIWWYLNSSLFLNHAIARSTGSDLPHISGNDIGLAPVPVPPVEEQEEVARRISEAMGWLDFVLEERGQALKLIDHIDQATLAKAFRGELVPQDPNDEPAAKLLERIRAARAAEPKPARRRKQAAGA